MRLIDLDGCRNKMLLRFRPRNDCVERQAATALVAAEEGCAPHLVRVLEGPPPGQVAIGVDEGELQVIGRSSRRYGVPGAGRSEIDSGHW